MQQPQQVGAVAEERPQPVLLGPPPTTTSPQPRIVGAVLEQVELLLGREPPDVAHEDATVGREATPELRVAVAGVEGLEVDAATPAVHLRHTEVAQLLDARGRGRERAVDLGWMRRVSRAAARTPPGTS